ncbi:MAG TPA: hypothetical protein VM243_20065 [Phycisphaerae bacterium]|nr:hypothetical protein [Phycisphaerae bacterium]
MSAVRVTTVWLRRMRRLTYAVVGAAALVSLYFTWLAAWRGDILRAAVASAATLAALGAGIMWAAALRAGLATIRNQRRLERLQQHFATINETHLHQQDRLDDLTDALERGRLQTDHNHREAKAELERTARRLTERLESLLARVETFSRLHDDQAERLERRVAAIESTTRRGDSVADLHTFEDRDWAVDEHPPGERTVAAYRHLVDSQTTADHAAGADRSAERRALRQEFAGCIHRREYASALARGDEIVRRFPDSGAASDFQRVRPHLLRRIELTARTARRPVK